jgi:hypothetical protein
MAIHETADFRVPFRLQQNYRSAPQAMTARGRRHISFELSAVGASRSLIHTN